jgi:hypothetical protein
MARDVQETGTDVVTDEDEDIVADPAHTHTQLAVLLHQMQIKLL